MSPSTGRVHSPRADLRAECLTRLHPTQPVHLRRVRTACTICRSAWGVGRGAWGVGRGSWVVGSEFCDGCPIRVILLHRLRKRPAGFA